MIVRAANKHPEEIEPGVIRTEMSHGEQLMLVEMAFRRGTRLANHSHPHEQATYVLRGVVGITLADRAFALAAGESCLIRPHVFHAAEAITDCVVLDAISLPPADGHGGSE